MNTNEFGEDENFVKLLHLRGSLNLMKMSIFMFCLKPLCNCPQLKILCRDGAGHLFLRHKQGFCGKIEKLKKLNKVQDKAVFQTRCCTEMSFGKRRTLSK